MLKSEKNKREDNAVAVLVAAVAVMPSEDLLFPYQHQEPFVALVKQHDFVDSDIVQESFALPTVAVVAVLEVGAAEAACTLDAASSPAFDVGVAAVVEAVAVAGVVVVAAATSFVFDVVEAAADDTSPSLS